MPAVLVLVLVSLVFDGDNYLVFIHWENQFSST